MIAKSFARLASVGAILVLIGCATSQSHAQNFGQQLAQTHRDSVSSLAASTGMIRNRAVPVRNVQRQHEQAVRSYYEGVLRDPDSARYTFDNVVTSTSGRAWVCGTVNSRNAYGGYTGRLRFAVRLSTDERSVDDAMTEPAIDRYRLAADTINGLCN